MAVFAIVRASGLRGGLGGRPPGPAEWGVVPPGDTEDWRARYDGGFAIGRASGGTGGRPPGGYGRLARPIRWRFCHRARIGGYGGSSPRGYGRLARPIRWRFLPSGALVLFVREPAHQRAELGADLLDLLRLLGLAALEE